MGALNFGLVATGTSAKAAFIAARRAARNDLQDDYDWDDEDADWDDGYSGTIWEKTSFKMYTVPSDYYKDRKAFFEAVEPIELQLNKYDPAGCIKIGEDAYYFFGWAAS